MLLPKISWQVRLGIILVLISVIIYSVKFIVLGNPENTYYYLFNALGFLPINVLLVTLVINELLSVRARRSRLQKLNMVIGTFFSEVGTWLLTSISDCDPGLDRVRSHLIVANDWSVSDFVKVRKRLQDYPYDVDIRRIDLDGLKQYLTERRNFLLRLLENPVLLEHESFTELLRAVFHLTEELERRIDVTRLPESDLDHLSGDIMRVYSRLAMQWLDYMQYLKDNYPYLFSLAIRTNPFDQQASPVVQ